MVAIVVFLDDVWHTNNTFCVWTYFFNRPICFGRLRHVIRNVNINRHFWKWRKPQIKKFKKRKALRIQKYKEIRVSGMNLEKKVFRHRTVITMYWKHCTLPSFAEQHFSCYTFCVTFFSSAFCVTFIIAGLHCIAGKSCLAYWSTKKTDGRSLAITAPGQTSSSSYSTKKKTRLSKKGI